MLESFTQETFEPRLGQTFRLMLDDGTSIHLRLTEATALGEPAMAGGRVPFSLVFTGRADIVLPQRTYLVENDDLGAFELFLVPIGPEGAGMRYEAVFT